MTSRVVALIFGLTGCFALGLAAQRLPLSNNTADQPLRVRVSEGAMQALLVARMTPEYPADAMAAGVQGKVVLRVVVDRKGAVSHVAVVSGHPLLIPAAIEAVKQWRYTPFLVKQTPVEVETTVEVTFALHSGVGTRTCVKKSVLA